MKVRKDFVTNSSSSSFVIGKKDDTAVTIDSVFQIIKGLYKELLDKRDAVIKYITENPDCKLFYNTEDGVFDSFDYVGTDKYHRRGTNEFEKKFGFDIYQYFAKNYDWLKCETYQDYEKYWINKINQDEDPYTHAPFTIADFLEEKNVTWVHFPPYNNDEIEEYAHKINSDSDVLGWYYAYINEAFVHPDNCDGCSCVNWCDEEECLQKKEEIKKQNIPEDKACLYLLGRVCIHSECGYIPDYVVEKLRDISEYSCNHMG